MMRAESFDSFTNRNERTEGDCFRDFTVENVARVARFDELLPWILRGLSDRKGDALPVVVDLQNTDRDIVANVDDLAGMVDVLP